MKIVLAGGCQSHQLQPESNNFQTTKIDEVAEKSPQQQLKVTQQ
jgi:hypothetical protein